MAQASKTEGVAEKNERATALLEKRLPLIFFFHKKQAEWNCVSGQTWASLSVGEDTHVLTVEGVVDHACAKISEYLKKNPSNSE